MSTAEKTAIEVFGTKEVSVKEFMGSSDKSLVLLSDYEKAKQNLIALKEKHEARVDELVVIEKLSPDELKELNGIRAELREPRYLVHNIEKNNISVFEAYKKTDKANLRELIEINSDLEDKATTKLQAEEQRKKDEKEAEAKAEETRVNRIKTDIENIETYCLQVIQKMNFENMKVSSQSVEQSLNAENDFEEYDLLLDQVKARVMKSLLEKTNDITARENQRLENEAMKKEIFDVRVNRLKEVGLDLNDSVFVSNEPCLNFQEEVILNASAADFEKILSDIKQSRERAEQAKRDSELKKQKDEQFDVRKSRLAEIGIVSIGNKMFMNPTNDAGLNEGKIYDATVTEFEQILVDAKESIKVGNEQRELAYKKARFEARKQVLLDLGFTYDESREYPLMLPSDEKFFVNEEVLVTRKDDWFEEYVADVKKSLEATELLAKKKADAENKARVKRLAADKKIISESLEVYFADLHLETENQETKYFIESANVKIQALKSDLLTQLNEL